MENNLDEVLAPHRYLGRGIIVGKSPDASRAFLGYFLMGRSQNSQNRVLYSKANEIRIDFFDPSLVEDASLIFYTPIVHFGDQIIISNGDQTQSILDSLRCGQSFQEALRGRSFEPDEPHYTPRISALLNIQGDFIYQISILKASKAPACNRFFYEYESVAGVGHFIHTYAYDDEPLPSFCGEPKPIKIPDSLDDFARLVWDNLDMQYRVSLCVQSIHLQSKQIETLIFNQRMEDARN